MQDLITIIVPVYNVENYVEESIRSIINQTYINIEILAINDGSVDNSLRILEKLAIQDKRIRIISQKNKGLSGARNTGLKNSNGKYILFLDSDDIFSTDTIIEELYRKIKKDNSDMVLFKYKTKNEKTKKVKTIEIRLSKDNYNLEEFCQEISEKNKKYYCFISACTKLYRKDIFNNLKFKENIYYEDTEIFLKLLTKVKKISFFNQVGIEYRIGREGSITTSSKKIDDMLKVADSIEDFYKKLEVSDKKKIAPLFVMILNNLYFIYFLSLRNEVNKEEVFFTKKILVYMNKIKASIIEEYLFKKNKLVFIYIDILGLKLGIKILKIFFRILIKYSRR